MEKKIDCRDMTACVMQDCGQCGWCKAHDTPEWRATYKKMDNELLIYTLTVALPIALFVTFVIWKALS